MLTCVYKIFSCMHMCTPHMWSVLAEVKTKKGIRSPGTSVIDTCQLPHECWKPNSGTLKEQKMFLSAKSWLQPHVNCYI